MAIKKTVEIGNEIVRAKAKKVDAIATAKVQKIITDLVDTMRAGGLVGMAAPQIGVSARIFVTEIRRTKARKAVDHGETLKVFINPVITKASEKMLSDYEGCGSVAMGQLFGPVKRPETISVHAWDENGEEFELETSGLLARIIQHEYDHLEGICFIDKVTDTKKLLGMSEYRKLVKQQIADAHTKAL